MTNIVHIDVPNHPKLDLEKPSLRADVLCGADACYVNTFSYENDRHLYLSKEHGYIMCQTCLLLVFETMAKEEKEKEKMHHYYYTITPVDLASKTRFEEIKDELWAYDEDDAHGLAEDYARDNDILFLADHPMALRRASEYPCVHYFIRVESSAACQPTDLL